MRPQQKSGRSRGKSNRNKSVGHSPNRVYESAGPEGKVRGTPQQIIDKYLGLARDAQLSGDRVMGENFHQHAEHYARILIAAQEAAGVERRDQNLQQGGGGYDRDDNEDRDDDDPRDRRSDGDRNEQPRFESGNGQQGRRDGGRSNEQSRPSDQSRPSEQNRPNDQSRQTEQRSDDQQPRAALDPDPRPARAKPRPAPTADEQPGADGLAAIDVAQDAPDLVETPEDRPTKPVVRRPRRPRVKPALEPAADAPETSGEPSTEAAE